MGFKKILDPINFHVSRTWFHVSYSDSELSLKQNLNSELLGF